MRNNFRKIRDGGKLRQQCVEQRQTVLPDARIRRVHQHLIEKQVDLGPQPGDGLFNWLTHDAAVLVVKIALGAGLEKRLVQNSTAREFRLLQDIANALEAGGERLEIERLAQALYALESGFEVHQVAPARGRRGVDFVVGEAPDIAEIVFHAILQEVAKSVIVEVRREVEIELPFDDDLNHALRGAAQRERIPRSARD